MVGTRILSWTAIVGTTALLGACGNSPLNSATAPTALVAADGLNASGGGAAFTLRVQCEQRNGRSKVSVDGNNVTAGSYTARVTSGANAAAAPARAAVGDEVEFDFDSDPANIAAGATAITSAFISGGTVTAQLLNAAGSVVSSNSASCRTR